MNHKIVVKGITNDPIGLAKAAMEESGAFIISEYAKKVPELNKERRTYVFNLKGGKLELDESCLTPELIEAINSKFGGTGA